MKLQYGLDLASGYIANKGLLRVGLDFEQECSHEDPLPQRHPHTMSSRTGRLPSAQGSYQLSLPRLGGHLRKVGSASTGKERWRNGSGAGSRRSTRARR